MSITKVFRNEHITAWCADTESIFRPRPAKDSLLASAAEGVFALRAGETGLTAFQIILKSDADTAVSAVTACGLSCLSTDAVDVAGREYKRSMPLFACDPWPFWCLIDSPKSNALDIEVTFADGSKIAFSIALDISPEYNRTFRDGESLTRIAWLNSRAGVSDSIVQGFAPVELSGRTIRILGRDITISPMGMIESIGTHFIGNNSTLADEPREMLAEAMGYTVFEGGKALDFIPVSLEFDHREETHVFWRAVSACGDMQLEIEGCVEFDGAVFLNACVKNAGGKNLSVRLGGALKIEFARYFMGLGLQGQKTPEEFFWTWDENRRHDSFWCGGVNGGVCVHPTAKGLSRPFVNIYFHHSKNYMPAAWVNGDKGCFRLKKDANVSFGFESGEFCADNEAAFCADIMISPFKRVDMKAHWRTHFFHKNYSLAYGESDAMDAASAGCTHINLHHGNDTMPFLNYPMYDVDTIAELADIAHKHGLGLKTYYTVRELTTRLPELPVLRSLRDEIFPCPTYAQGGVPGQNGVDEFLDEIFGDEIIPAWKHVFTGGKYDGITDPSVITDPQGRIANFYAGSLEWLVKTTGIDGLYIDDTGLDRWTMRRVRRIFAENRPDAKLDFHTCNHFMDSPGLGFGFGHNMLIYMELLPYLDSLWVGEGYDYDAANPEYLLTEISGLPFGVMSEMLEGKCNPWRGMLLGMTSRYPYCIAFGGPSPVPIWKARSEFENAEMIGFWEENSPVDTGREDVLCTVYRNGDSGRMLLCIANFADGDASFTLKGDELAGKRIFAPAIEGVQEERTFSANESITLPEKGGIMLIAE
ncbi:MAG: hypothetical protein E7335_03600 [Clostridiales bacterium]|nr:hypothetical protein [Clostridiales bacterium]